MVIMIMKLIMVMIITYNDDDDADDYDDDDDGRVVDPWSLIKCLLFPFHVSFEYWDVYFQQVDLSTFENDYKIAK